MSHVDVQQTEPSAAFMHATASYSDAIAPDDTEITEAPAENDEKDAQSSADGNPDEAKDLRPLASAEDFMKSFRALQLEAKTNSDAAAAEEPSPQRRLIFKNLPEWTTVSHVLHLVFGSAIERAWSETSGEVNVQFADAGQCNRYLERHPDGIPIKVGEDVTTISIELMDNDDEHPELARRLRADASRVVCLSGLPTSLIGRHDESILGIVSQASWEDKAFEQVLIKNRKDVSLPFGIAIDASTLTDLCRATLTYLSLSSTCTMAGSSTKTSRKAPMTAFASSRLIRKLPNPWCLFIEKRTICLNSDK
jgi:hypothetical protein